MKQYKFTFSCIDNSGKHQNFIVTAKNKDQAIAKGFEKARKNAKGDIIRWDCKLNPIF